MKARNIALDLLKLFAIFLVLWGHCIQHMKATNIDEPTFLFIYSFHMPLFMMISGYFSQSSLKMDFGPMLKKKFIQLLLPCITWFFIAYAIPKLALLPLRSSSMNYSFDSFFQVLLHNFWFLKSVFVCYVLAYFAQKYKQGGAILTLLISQFIPLFSVGFLYPMFLIGILVKQKDIFITFKGRRVLLVVSLLVWLTLYIYRMKWIEYNVPIDQLINNPSLLLERWYRVIVGAAGSLFWIVLFIEFFGNKKEGVLCSMSQYGKYTLGVYILQTFFLEAGLSRLIHLDKYSIIVSDFAIAPVIAVVVLIVCVCIIKQTERFNELKLWLWGYK